MKAPAFFKIPVRIITSPNNSIIKEAAALKEKKYRDASQAYILEGPNLVREMISSGGMLKALFIKSGAGSEELDIAASFGDQDFVFELSEEAFGKISASDNPQGIVAVAEKKIYTAESFLAEVQNKNILVLDRIQDPGNEGTLIRSAEAMGFGGILIIKGSADPYQPKVVRSSAGSVCRMPMLFAESGTDAMEIVKSQGKRPYAACMSGSVSVYDADLKEDTAVIIGNEGNGVGEDILSAAEKLYIPMEGSTESLNAAVAACIIMYESKRQRK